MGSQHVLVVIKDPTVGALLEGYRELPLLAVMGF